MKIIFQSLGDSCAVKSFNFLPLQKAKVSSVSPSPEKQYEKYELKDQCKREFVKKERRRICLNNILSQHQGIKQMEPESDCMLCCQFSSLLSFKKKFLKLSLSLLFFPWKRTLKSNFSLLFFKDLDLKVTKQQSFRIHRHSFRLSSFLNSKQSYKSLIYPWSSSLFRFYNEIHRIKCVLQISFTSYQNHFLLMQESQTFFFFLSATHDQQKGVQNSLRNTTEE